MNIDHVHFYVEDAARSRDWFVQTLGFDSVAGGTGRSTQTEVVKSGPVYFVLSSPRNLFSPVAEFLRLHPPGVVDLAFRVADVAALIARAIDSQAKILAPVQTHLGAQGRLRWGQILGWGALRHTFVERSGITPLLPFAAELGLASPLVSQHSLADLGTEQFADLPCCTGIDHVVLNVAAGELKQAVGWYQKVLGFQPGHTFEIRTPRSALRSEVMVHPEGAAQFPINEP
ncbi:MAG TPA: VOC family protein, partial [Candidatus Caenarcaniphilales bacterium]